MSCAARGTRQSNAAAAHDDPRQERDQRDDQRDPHRKWHCGDGPADRIEHAVEPVAEPLQRPPQWPWGRSRSKPAIGKDVLRLTPGRVGIDHGIRAHRAHTTSRASLRCMSSWMSYASSRMRRSKYNTTVAVAMNGVVRTPAIVLAMPWPITMATVLPPVRRRRLTASASAALQHRAE